MPLSAADYGQLISPKPVSATWTVSGRFTADEVSAGGERFRRALLHKGQWTALTVDQQLATKRHSVERKDMFSRIVRTAPDEAPWPATCPVSNFNGASANRA
jgi:hypothetical protein